jgi:putative hemolysin
MRRGRLVALTALVILGLGAAMPAGASLRHNGRIAYTRWSMSFPEASYSVRPDGTDIRPILADGRPTTSAAYGP